jgi:PI-3-kinase-related kinase SMG-1
MAKVWSGFANWALEIGQKVFASAENGRVALTSAEEKSVLEAIDDHLSEDQCQEVISLMSQVHLKQSQGEIEVDKSDFMKKTLSELPCVKGLSEDILERLMAAWHLIQKRLFYYHETAAKSYFKFIALSSGSAKEQRVISATLRLLQLIVKHSLELQDVLQEGLAETPSRCWRAIIPQLFSRLNHPVKVVRNRISDLLSRIAEDHPHLVIYPAIVGSMASEPQVSKIFEDNLDEDAEDADSPKMQSAHEKIVQVMASSMPESVNHVKILVSELQRISLLWDELWFGTIQQYSPEIIKRVKKMEEEAKRLDKNTSLSDDEKRDLVKDKYFIIFKPLLYVFSKVEAITKNPESPTEVWFISKYGKLVDEMMQKIREPSDFAKPREVWSLVDQLQGKIAAKLQKKSLLKLADISPVLANLKDSSIPMPGQEDRKHLFVSQIEGTLTILHTKTKPKRFSLRGNDGKKYTYLFKGLEDMHLDERIMQFLSIANTLMIKTGSGSGGYRYVVCFFEKLLSEFVQKNKI